MVSVPINKYTQTHTHTQRKREIFSFSHFGESEPIKVIEEYTDLFIFYFFTLYPSLTFQVLVALLLGINFAYQFSVFNQTHFKKAIGSSFHPLSMM